MSWNVALEIVVRVQNYSCDSNLSSLCNVYNIFRYNGLHLAFYCRFDSLEKGAECHTFIHISMFYSLHSTLDIPFFPFSRQVNCRENSRREMVAGKKSGKFPSISNNCWQFSVFFYNFQDRWCYIIFFYRFGCVNKNLHTHLHCFIQIKF